MDLLVHQSLSGGTFFVASLMILILDGKGKWVRFVTALDLIKCFKQIKKQRLLLTYAPLSEVSSNILSVQEGVTHFV